ncbi:MAG: N-acetylneuraminate synthase family protein [Solirubrobacterales bacterium]
MEEKLRRNGDRAPIGASERVLEIDGRVIGDHTDCYVIAEIGHNHQGSLKQAIELFKKAAECGVDAVKLQKRDNRALYTTEYYNRPYDHENSFGTTYGEHREVLEFGRDEYLELQQVARDLEITMLATAFDVPSADFLAELDVPAIKIASADLRNTPLLRHVAGLGKPMIISTGAARLEDVHLAHEVVAPINSEFAFLQCTAVYPPTWEELDLRVIDTYRREFPDTVIGYSGHDSGIAMATAAYVLGARIVEKHFTLNRALKGTDHAFSLEPHGLQSLVRDLRRTRVALGDGSKRMYRSETEPAKKMGKKLVAARDLPAGHVLAEEDIAAKSPGDGLPPCELDRLVGRRLGYPVTEELPLTFDLLEDPAVGGPGRLARASGEVDGSPVAAAAGDDES